MSKMTRQLQLYDFISGVPEPAHASFGFITGPSEIMRKFGISRRMLQRDLKDLRDCGLIRVKYDRKRDMYLQSGDPVFDETAGERRKQHLRRLYRLGTLVMRLPRVYRSELDHYESLVRELEDFIEFSEEDPETFSPEDIETAREEAESARPDFPDLIKSYRALFPDISDRTRQRDFRELCRAGFDLDYSRDYKTYIFMYEDSI